MTQIEIIDRLCDITCRQAIAIKELTHIVNQSDTIDKETKKEINLRKFLHNSLSDNAQRMEKTIVTNMKQKIDAEIRKARLR